MLFQPKENDVQDVRLVALMNLACSRDSFNAAHQQYEAFIQGIPAGPVKAAHEALLQEFKAFHANFLKELQPTRDLLTNDVNALAEKAKRGVQQVKSTPYYDMFHGTTFFFKSEADLLEARAIALDCDNNVGAFLDEMALAGVTWSNDRNMIDV